MERSEYDRYGDDPKVAKRRQEIRDAFLENMRMTPAPLNIYANWDKNYDSLSEGYHGRWEKLTLADCQFLFEMKIAVDWFGEHND